MKRQRRRNLKKYGPQWCEVYALLDPDSCAVRYIGQTRSHLEIRLKYHILAPAKRKRFRRKLSPVEKWIDGLLTEGKQPLIQSIEKHATWDVSEIIWIERHRANGGQPLLNVLRGGRDTMQGLKLAS